MYNQDSPAFTASTSEDVSPIPQMGGRDQLGIMYKGKLPLDPNPKRARALYDAGRLYAELHHAARLVGVKAMDITTIGVDGGRGSYGPCSDLVRAYRRKLDAINRILGSGLERVLVAVVIDDKPISAVANLIADPRGKSVRQRIAREHLLKALDTLDRHFFPSAKVGSRGIISAYGDGSSRSFENKSS